MYRGNTTKWANEDEKVATLSFVLLDKNKNKLWERKEWKTFRELVTSSGLVIFFKLIYLLAIINIFH